MAPSWRDIGIGLFVGTLILGPLIWTAVGRELTTKAVSKGAKVTEAKVREWTKLGEA